MSSVPLVKLNNGMEMPAIGLGTWSGTTEEEHAKCFPWVLSALKAGYRHLDTAYGYGTEKYVGQAVRESGVPREEIFITTKLPGEHHGSVAEALKESLERAQFTYYDLYLMHFPMASRSGEGGIIPFGESPTFNETWAAMEKLLETGKVKTIGVSNFSVKNLEILLKTAKVVPAVNQVEMHPLLAQNDLLEYCKSKGIVLTAYSPTGYAQVREHPEILKIAKKHGVSSAQVSLAWHVARGTTACPKSANVERQKENLMLPNLDAEDMKAINSIDENKRLCNDIGPDGKLWGGWTKEEMGW